jgi:hypothetical protein
VVRQLPAAVRAGLGHLEEARKHTAFAAIKTSATEFRANCARERHRSISFHDRAFGVGAANNKIVYAYIQMMSGRLAWAGSLQFTNLLDRSIGASPTRSKPTSGRAGWYAVNSPDPPGTGKSGRRRSDDHQPILWRGTPEGTVGRARRDGLVRVRDHSKARRRHASSRCHRSFHERSATPLGSAT